MIHIAKPCVGEEEKKAVCAVLDSGMIASGSIVTQFENAFAEYCGMPYCIACSSGTTALELALRALGIGEGDKVLTTSYSFIASTNCIVYVGATPVFTDIDADTFLITPKHIRKALKNQPDIKALVVVHLFGQPCDMPEIMKIAEEHNIIVVEDCAQSHGASVNGIKTGTFGDAACYSFYPTKNMTTSEGGAVLCKNTDVANKCRLLVSHGMKTRYYHDIIGYNYRMTNICAAIGIEQLKKLHGFNKKRQENASYLIENIKNPLVSTPKTANGCEHVYHQFTVRVKNREEFIKHLETNGVGYGIFYPLSIPEQDCYKDMEFETSYEVTDKIKNEVVSLPVHPLLSRDDLKTIVSVVNSFLVKG